MSDLMNIELVKFSKVALQFMNRFRETKSHQQSPRLQAPPAHVLTSRISGFTLAAIMGKTSHEQVEADFNQDELKDRNSRLFPMRLFNDIHFSKNVYTDYFLS